MTEMQIIFLSLLQGITEFLPVSSSGHLILFSKWTTFPDQGQAMDVALHIGSLIAVLIYFGSTLWEIAIGLFKCRFMPNFKNEGCQLFYLLLWATLPIIVAGSMLKYYGTDWLRSTKLIGWNILIYGILLWFIDSVSITARKIRNLEFKDAFFIGMAQCLALLPGISRSGITITMCRFLGMERREAAKFSMLLSIPAILAAGLLTGYLLWQQENMQQITNAFNIMGYSFIFSLMAIYILMQWLKKWSFLPFAIYRILLGTLLLLDAYGIYDIQTLWLG